MRGPQRAGGEHEPPEVGRRGPDASRLIAADSHVRLFNSTFHCAAQADALDIFMTTLGSAVFVVPPSAAPDGHLGPRVAT